MNRLYFNYRDHRKITCIDGDVAYTGGANLADEYADIIRRFGYWKDCGLRLEGEGAWGLTREFIYMWERLGGEMHNEHDYYRPIHSAASDGFCQTIVDGPDNNPDATAEGCLMDLQPVIPLPTEGGDQGGMDVDDPVRPATDEVRGQDGQEPGQHDQIHPVLRQRLHQRRLKRLLPQLLPGQGNGRHAAALCPLQSVGFGIAGEDQHDLPVGQGACFLSVQQRLQVGAAAGDQHSDTGLVQHRITRSSPEITSPIT